MIHNVEDGQTNLKLLENVLHGFHNVSPFSTLEKENFKRNLILRKRQFVIIKEEERE